MKVNRSRFLALVTAIGGLTGACSSSSSGPSDAGSSSSSGGSRDSGSSSGSSSGGLIQDSGGSSGSSSGGTTCSAGQSPCAGSCCNANAYCFTDPAGNHSCATKCATSSDCLAASPCCALIPGTGGVQVCLPNGTIPSQQCVCTTSTECTTGCCAPTTDSSGNPTKPLVCKAADGSHYGCCMSGTSCSESTDCCLTVTTTGSKVCEQACQTSATCGNSTCQPLTSGMCLSDLGSCVPSP